MAREWYILVAAQIQDDQLAAAVSDKIEAVIEANSVFAPKVGT